jgi:hypothetical protein
MKRWTSFFAVLLFAVALVTPAWARAVRFETKVPLVDHSEAALNMARGNRLRGLDLRSAPCPIRDALRQQSPPTPPPDPRTGRAR